MSEYAKKKNHPESDMVQPASLPAAAIASRTTLEDEQVALLNRSDYLGNPDLEIVLPDSEDEQQARQKPGRSRRKRRKGKIHKQPEEVDGDPPSPAFRSFPLTPFPVDMSSHTLGQLAPRAQLFCPLPAITKFPYKYLRGADSEIVSKAYFADGKFRARGWTLFYIHTLLPSATKPLIVVPAIEVESLLFEINSKFNVKLGFPHSTIEPGFLLAFQEQGSPRPRYLGRLTTENLLETMESKIPGPSFKQEGEDGLDARSFPAFRAKMENAIQAGKNKSKASKEKKKKERIVTKVGWCSQLKRARCYLGLRPKWSSLENPHSIPNLTWEEEQKAVEEEQIARASMTKNVDVTKPVPNSFDENVVFISIDVESYERDRRAITEIGISTLDTNDLVDIPPGKGGVAWMKKIRSRHFRVKEYSHLVNTDFISGCGDRFEKEFGSSEWISIKEAPQVVASCFMHPYSAPDLVNHLGDNPNNEAGQTSFRSNDASSLPGPVGENDTASMRNIILVGHDIKADIEYLRSIGYELGNVSGILEAIDTADIFRALKHEQQPRSLGGLLLDLELVGWNLHNAGNDAAYTLQAMIGICFKSRRSRQEIAQERDARMEDAAKEAKEQAKQDGEEWNLADKDEGDGGRPVPLIWEDRALNPRNGGSKVNRAERSAMEKLAAKEQKKQTEAASVTSGDVDTWHTKDELTGWADDVGVVSSHVEGSKPGKGVTAAVEEGLSKLTDQKAVSSADHESLSPAGAADSTGATTDRTNIGSGIGSDGLQELGERKTSHAGPIQHPAETSNPLQSSTIEQVDEESVPVPTRMLDRLALLEAMDEDADDGGVRL